MKSIYPPFYNILPPLESPPFVLASPEREIAPKAVPSQQFFTPLILHEDLI
jgi:hypothetical protein